MITVGYVNVWKYDPEQADTYEKGLCARIQRDRVVISGTYNGIGTGLALLLKE